jgi:hypothetical protein
LQGNSKSYFTTATFWNSIPSACSTMAKLNITIPDLELPDGSKVPMVSWQKFCREFF